MSNHKTPLTELERKGLEAHGLGRYIGKPSQLADVFRAGVAWALANNPQAERIQAEIMRMHGRELKLQMALNTPAQPAPVQEHLGFISQKQIHRIKDLEDYSGVYIPMRKTSAGNFDAPVYTTPPAQPAPVHQGQLAEADRRAGAAERELETCRSDLARINRVRDKMKDEWGVDRNVSFDAVWAEALKLKRQATPLAAQPAIPEGYVMLSVELLKLWGKHKEVMEAARYPRVTTEKGQP